MASFLAVSTRVFHHCAAIAPPVIEWSPFTGFEAPASDFWCVPCSSTLAVVLTTRRRAPKPNL